MYAVLNEVDAFLFDAMTTCIVFITIYFDLSSLPIPEIISVIMIDSKWIQGTLYR